MFSATDETPTALLSTYKQAMLPTVGEIKTKLLTLKMLQVLPTMTTLPATIALTLSLGMLGAIAFTDSAATTNSTANSARMKFTVAKVAIAFTAIKTEIPFTAKPVKTTSEVAMLTT